MSLFERITGDKKIAFEARDKLKTSLLSTLIGECSLKDKSPSDEVVVRTINTFINRANELQEAVKKNDGNLLHIVKSAAEVRILEEYLPPKQEHLTDVEILIHLNDNQFPDIGTCQKWFKVNYAGRYDGKELTAIYKANLK